MNVLITYFSQTNNTGRIARAIFKEVFLLGHKADLQKITDLTVHSLNAYDVVFLGSTCHDTDLAMPVKRFLEQVGKSPPFVLAGFVTHAAQMPEEGDRERMLYEKWAGNCIRTFQRISKEKQITFLGYFHCQGVPSAPIEAFIHSTIITEDEAWAKYSANVRGHPNEGDLQAVKAFTRQVITLRESNQP